MTNSSRRVRCPACKSSPMPGMQRTVDYDGRDVFSTCKPCQGSESITLISSAEAKRAARWMSPEQVMAMKEARA